MTREESLNAQVYELYRTVLAREPDEGGLRSNLAALRSGIPYGQLIQRMLESREFQEKAKGLLFHAADEDASSFAATFLRPAHSINIASSMRRLHDIPADPQGRIAIVGPLPPARTGIAFANLHTFIVRQRPVDFFGEFATPADYDALSEIVGRSTQAHRVFVHQILAEAANRVPYDAIVFSLGNSYHNHHVLYWLLRGRQLAGKAQILVYLHDPVALGVLRGLSRLRDLQIEDEFKSVYGAECWKLLRARNYQHLLKRRIIGFRAITLGGRVDGIIVNSAAAKEMLIEDNRDLDPTSVHVLFHPVLTSPEARSARARSTSLRIGTFGVPTSHKRISTVVEAVSFLDARGLDVGLTIAGYCSSLISDEIGVSGRLKVEIKDSPSDEELLSLMAAVDVAVELRAFNTGETSGIVSLLMGLQKPVVVSRVGAFKEFGDAVVFTEPDAPPSTVADSILWATSQADVLAAKAAEFSAVRSPRAFCQQLDEIIARTVPKKEQCLSASSRPTDDASARPLTAAGDDGAMRVWATNGKLWTSMEAYRLAAQSSLADLTLVRDHGPLKPGELPLIAVVKDEKWIIDVFLAHYRKLGVSRFFIVDNGSTDGTVQALCAHPDVDLWQTTASFGEANQGGFWRDGLLRDRATDRWILTVDADELLVFKGAMQGIRELIRVIEARGESRLLAPLLDLYPKGPIASAHIAPGDNPLDVCTWFDAEPESATEEERGVWFVGGARRRLFFSDVQELRPGLTKFPLVFYDGETAFIGAHSPVPYSRNHLKPFARLLHIKLHSDLVHRAVRAIAEGQYWEDATEYRRYLATLTENPSLSAFYGRSKRYEGPETLIAAGFMSDPSRSLPVVKRLVHGSVGAVARRLSERYRQRLQAVFKSPAELPTRLPPPRPQHRAAQSHDLGLGWVGLPRIVRRPELLIDVGAGDGTRELYDAFPGTPIIAIDPLIENRAKLQRSPSNYDLEIHTCAVGAARSSMMMDVSESCSDISSLLVRTGAMANWISEKRPVEIYRLDELVTRSGRTAIGLKIDSEGYECDVIRGAEGLLAAVIWIIAEISMTPRFVDDPMFAGVYQLAAASGFVFIDVIDQVRESNGRLRRIDALFVQEDSNIGTAQV